MDRLISEQAVIDSIEFFQMNPQHFDFVNLIDDIKEIPSAEPKWIPISERYPEKDEYVDDVPKLYLIQDEYGDMHVAHYSSIGWIPTHSLKAIGDDVVAWTNLPEKYEESEERE